MHEDLPGVIVGARRGSPLVLGDHGKGEHFRASDVGAIIAAHAREVVYPQRLRDRCARAGSFRHLHPSPDRTRISRSARSSTHRPGRRQGQVPALRYAQGNLRAAKHRARRHARTPLFEEATAKLGGLNMSNAGAPRRRPPVLSGCGTAMHAAMVGEYLIESLARVPVECEFASELRYRNLPMTRDTLVLRHQPERRNRRHPGRPPRVPPQRHRARRNGHKRKYDAASSQQARGKFETRAHQAFAPRGADRRREPASPRRCPALPRRKYDGIRVSGQIRPVQQSGTDARTSSNAVVPSVCLKKPSSNASRPGCLSLFFFFFAPRVLKASGAIVGHGRRRAAPRGGANRDGNTAPQPAGGLPLGSSSGRPGTHASSKVARPVLTRKLEARGAPGGGVRGGRLELGVLGERAFFPGWRARTRPAPSWVPRGYWFSDSWNIPSFGSSLLAVFPLKWN